MTRRRRRSKQIADTNTPPRSHAYRQLKHPFTPQSVFSDDAIAAMHQTALRTLEELGMKVLHPEARMIFKTSGARVD